MTSPAGDTELALVLPGHSCTLLVRMQNGTMFFHPMKIDTLIVEPEERIVSLVWRAVIEKTQELRAVDAHLHKREEADFMKHISVELDKMPSGKLEEALHAPMEERNG